MFLIYHFNLLMVAGQEIVKFFNLCIFGVALKMETCYKWLGLNEEWSIEDGLKKEEV